MGEIYDKPGIFRHKVQPESLQRMGPMFLRASAVETAPVHIGYDRSTHFGPSRIQRDACRLGIYLPYTKFDRTFPQKKNKKELTPSLQPDEPIRKSREDTQTIKLTHRRTKKSSLF